MILRNSTQAEKSEKKAEINRLSLCVCVEDTKEPDPTRHTQHQSNPIQYNTSRRQTGTNKHKPGKEGQLFSTGHVFNEPVVLLAQSNVSIDGGVGIENAVLQEIRVTRGRSQCSTQHVDRSLREGNKNKKREGNIRTTTKKNKTNQDKKKQKRSVID